MTFRKAGWTLVLLALALTAVLAMSGRLAGDEEERPSADLVSQAAEVDLSGYARAEGPQPLRFPEDHGPHPDYQTEWWYYTGNLETGDGRHFGYQLTFFRRALEPPAQAPDRASDWDARQAYMAHFALTDVDGGRHYDFERLARGAAGLAGARAGSDLDPPFAVWLEDWRVEQTGPDRYALTAEVEELALELELHDTKGPILQGDRGYSPKGPDPGQASYYISLTRLESAGRVRLGGQTFEVRGLSWMDHEFSTSALGRDQVGWDWFALHLDDDSELMFFQIRKADGSVDPFSSGTYIAPDGQTRPLAAGDFSIQVTGNWESPDSGAVYPAGWRVAIPALELALDIQPYLADQEMNVSYNYWEGAVRIDGRGPGGALSGSGYVELTGYAGSMGGEF